MSFRSQICGQSKEAVELGSDEFLEKIMLPDKNGKTFAKRGYYWKVGRNYPFVAEFYAKTQGEEMK